MDYEIQPNSRRCTATGRELQPGERFYSALVEEERRFVRRDIRSSFKRPTTMHLKHRSITTRRHWLESMLPHCWSWPRGANGNLNKITEETHARAQGRAASP